jgi:cytochrome c
MRLAAAAAIVLAGAGCAAQPARQAASGEIVYRRCVACHALEPGVNTPAGPTLHAVVGRPIAAEPGFNFSPALRRLASRYPRWSPELLDRFVADPETVAPGTEMGFAGLADAGERRALVAWLQHGASGSDRSRP